MKIVLCCGVFDLLHVGHIRHLEEASMQGDRLIVAVTQDDTVGKVGRPIIPERERLEMVYALRFVWSAGLTKDSIAALHTWTPNVFCKGADYVKNGLLPAEREYCQQNGVEIYYTRPNPRTTTSIIERIQCTS